MSDYESHSGKIRRVYQNNGESFTGLCLRLWKLEGRAEEDFKPQCLFEEFYDKYVCINDSAVWEVFDHEYMKEDEDTFCKLNRVKKDTYDFHTRFYNSGTCFSEMIADAIAEVKMPV